MIRNFNRQKMTPIANLYNITTPQGCSFNLVSCENKGYLINVIRVRKEGRFL